ncbi:hypothetical protein [Rhodococcus sp. Q]|uniref:hypothetical protein n=1 Tax=Rhodococcus sp. Q TaxID=2502252 RepID=UPI0010F97A61|nr:hypothetical protein [Rhodococcus sp. Q]
MTVSTYLKRSAAAFGLCAGVVLAPSAAWAGTSFDDPPPSCVPIGLGDATVEAETGTEESELAPGTVEFEIDDGAGTGANVVWVNTDNWQFGTVMLTPQGDEAEPKATVSSGPGHVMAAVYGLYTDAEDQTCLLLPGVNTAITVPR